MGDVMYIRHNFGLISFKERQNNFINEFKLKQVKNLYYKNENMIVKIDKKMIVAILTNEDNLTEKMRLNRYFYD